LTIEPAGGVQAPEGARARGRSSSRELEESGGKTTIKTTMAYASKQVRDGMLKSGMKEGIAMSYDRLEEALGS
jgi:hypothetical protein